MGDIPARVRRLVAGMAERFWIWLAWKLPRPLAKWAYVRVAASSTVIRGDKTPGEISIMDAINDWDSRLKGSS